MTQEAGGATKMESSQVGQNGIGNGCDNDELALLREQNAVLKKTISVAYFQKKLELSDLPTALRDEMQKIPDDRSAIFAGLMSGRISWHSVPDKWKNDADLVCDVWKERQMTLPRRHRMPEEEERADEEVQNKIQPFMWRDLPFQMKMDINVARSALRAHGGPHFTEIPLPVLRDSDESAKYDLLATAFLYKKMAYAHFEERPNGSFDISFKKEGNIENVRFENLPSELWRNHKELALFGVVHELISADDCPCLDREFCKQALQVGRLYWYELPSDLRRDIEFARSITVGDEYLAENIFNEFVELRSDASFWQNRVCFCLTSHGDVQYMLNEFAPPNIRSNHALMLKACKLDAGAFSEVAPSLATDRRFLEAALEQNVRVLGYWPRETQIRHRDLIEKALPAVAKFPDSSRISGNILPTFQEDRTFVLLWLKVGLFMPDIPDNWREDKVFMTQVLEHRPDLYAEARGEVLDDPEIMTIAFASCPDIARRWVDNHQFDRDDKFVNYTKLLSSQFIAVSGFSQCVLGNLLSTQSVKATGTHLTLLNQGPETTLKYKKLLADYLDIPTGIRQWRLRRAFYNVREAIHPWFMAASWSWGSSVCNDAICAEKGGVVFSVPKSTDEPI